MLSFILCSPLIYATIQCDQLKPLCGSVYYFLLPVLTGRGSVL